jgi:biopolymer transport protein ExbD
MSVGSSNPNAVKNDINVTPLIDVLLVLLIIFLVTLPLLMKMETLDVPRDADADIQPADAVQLLVRVRADASMTLCDGQSRPQAIEPGDIARQLRPRIAEQQNGKVVFVDFDDGVPWKTAVATMDSIRALATDVSHDEVKVALRVRGERKPGEPKGFCDEE